MNELTEQKEVNSARRRSQSFHLQSDGGNIWKIMTIIRIIYTGVDIRVTSSSTLQGKFQLVLFHAS